jgi:ribonuclease HI
MQSFVKKFIHANYDKHSMYYMPSHIVAWFTDGSCHKNGKKNSSAGYSAICVSGYKKGTLLYKKLDSKTIPPTNIRAEGFAIQNVINVLINDIKSDEWKNAIIYTDSEFWIKMIYEYMPKWKPTAFDSKANPDITKKLWKDWNIIINSGKKIELVHVFSHNKDNSANSLVPFKQFCFKNNELADDLANTARELTDNKLREEHISSYEL